MPRELNIRPSVGSSSQRGQLDQASNVAIRERRFTAPRNDMAQIAQIVQQAGGVAAKAVGAAAQASRNKNTIIAAGMRTDAVERDVEQREDADYNKEVSARRAEFEQRLKAGENVEEIIAERVAWTESLDASRLNTSNLQYAAASRESLNTFRTVQNRLAITAKTNKHLDRQLSVILQEMDRAVDLDSMIRAVGADPNRENGRDMRRIAAVITANIWDEVSDTFDGLTPEQEEAARTDYETKVFSEISKRMTPYIKQDTLDSQFSMRSLAADELTTSVVDDPNGDHSIALNNVVALAEPMLEADRWAYGTDIGRVYVQRFNLGQLDSENLMDRLDELHDTGLISYGIKTTLESAIQRKTVATGKQTTEMVSRFISPDPNETRASTFEEIIFAATHPNSTEGLALREAITSIQADENFNLVEDLVEAGVTQQQAEKIVTGDISRNDVDAIMMLQLRRAIAANDTSDQIAIIEDAAGDLASPIQSKRALMLLASVQGNKNIDPNKPESFLNLHFSTDMNRLINQIGDQDLQVMLRRHVRTSGPFARDLRNKDMTWAEQTERIRTSVLEDRERLSNHIQTMRNQRILNDDTFAGRMSVMYVLGLTDHDSFFKDKGFRPDKNVMKDVRAKASDNGMAVLYSLSDKNLADVDAVEDPHLLHFSHVFPEAVDESEVMDKPLNGRAAKELGLPIDFNGSILEGLQRAVIKKAQADGIDLAELALSRPQFNWFNLSDGKVGVTFRVTTQEGGSATSYKLETSHPMWAPNPRIPHYLKRTPEQQLQDIVEGDYRGYFGQGIEFDQEINYYDPPDLNGPLNRFLEGE